MNTRQKGTSIGTAATLIIFCIFSVSVITVLLLGASAYRNINTTSRAGHDERICLSFVWTRIKNSDGAGGFYVGEFDGAPALFIDEMEGGTRYRTIIYYYDGWMRELFFEEGLEFNRADGSRISRVESLSFEELENGLIKASSGTESILIAARSGFGFTVQGGGVR